MDIVIGIVIGLVIAGAVAGGLFVYISRQSRQTEQKLQQTQEELRSTQDALQEKKIELTTANIELAQERKMAAQKETERAENEKKAEAERRDREAKEEEQRKSQLEQMEKTFDTIGERLLKKRQEELQNTNAEAMRNLMMPLREQMDNVNKLMSETKSASDKNSASLQGAINVMVEQTAKLGQDANHLADALKNRGKVHGDWGEQVLADILEGSGLREGVEFFTQDSYKGEHGNELRPDVIVNMPDGSRVIIDSKVSLTAYADALGAENEAEREEAIKHNYESVWKHVRELAEKQYPKYIDNAIHYVLMFVPNEGSYIMAMNYKPELGQEAFRQGVVIVNPTNLMLSLNLILQTWQNTRQEDNCKKILEAASSMYDKVVGLVDTCNTLGNQLETVNKTYHTVMGQLSEGTGNVLRRVDGLKALGVTSTKKVKTRKNKAEALPGTEEEGNEAMNDSDEG